MEGFLTDSRVAVNGSKMQHGEECEYDEGSGHLAGHFSTIYKHITYSIK